MKIKNYYILFFSLFYSFISALNNLVLKSSDIQFGIDYESKKYLVFNNFDIFYKKPFYPQE